MAEAWVSVHMMTGIGLGLVAGYAIALAHLAALAVNVRLYLMPGAAWRPIGLHVARFAALVSSFSIAAMFGAAPLIAMLAGFTLGRAFALRRHR